MVRAPRSVSFSQAFRGGGLPARESSEAACWDEGHLKLKCHIYHVKQELTRAPVSEECLSLY